MYTHFITNIGDARFGLALGPSVQYVLDATAQRSHQSGGTTTVLADGEISDSNPFRFSVKGGMQAEFGIFDNEWIIVPGIYYDYGLTKTATQDGWQVHSLMLQVDLRTVNIF